MAAALLSKSFFFFFLAALLLLFITPSSAYEFRVGGSRGWIEPTGDESETYNHWASRNRFHIGDSLYFKYENDSVLQVDKEQYKECNGTDPAARFDDGNTTFRFDRYGFFFFISGEPGHCELGQRLIVRVMVHPGADAEAPSPALGLGSSLSPEAGSTSGQSTSDAAPTGITAAAAAMITAMVVPAIALVVWLGQVH